jgi:hypothetical protein
VGLLAGLYSFIARMAAVCSYERGKTFKMAVKRYRKVCNYCGGKFTGRRSMRYCSDSCRQLNYLEGKRYGYMKALGEMLTVELSYLKSWEVKKVVEVVGYVVKKYKKNSTK